MFFKDYNFLFRVQKIKSQFKIFLLVFLFFPSLSYAVRINKLSIRGNKIIETGLIRSHIQLKKGSYYSKKKVQKDVQHLFSLGFFDDIKVRTQNSKKGLNVTYQFKERVHIGEIEFKGNDNLKTEDLKELSLVKEDSFLNFDTLQKTFFAVKEKYKEKGYYLAELSYRTEKNSKDIKKKLIIEIKENKKLFIKKINFIGNRNISSSELKAFMQTKEKNLLSLFGSSGTFNPEHISRDLQFMEYYYRDKGYLNVRVQKPEVTVTADKKFIYISFFISEGLRFKLGQVAFRGDTVVSTETVMNRLKLKEKKYFSLGRLQEDIQLISLLYKNKGYALVQVKPLFFPDQAEEDKIHILFKVEKGEVYKLDRIHIAGNKSTRDKVILRRLRIREKDFYNESRKELTRQLLQQLGYFEEISLHSKPSETKKGKLDLFVNVKERENTGEANLVGGYNSQTKLFIQGGIKKQKFLGLDQSIAVNLSFSRYQEIFTFGYQNPYFLDSQWNFAFDIFNAGQNASNVGNSSFTSSQTLDYFAYFRLDTGFSVSLGRHLTEFSTVFLKYKLQNQLLEDEPVYFLRDLPVLSSLFDFLFGKVEKLDGDNVNLSAIETNFSDIYNLEEGTGLNSSLSAILEYDRTNDRYYASKGFFVRLSTEYSGLGGDFNYVKFQGKFRHYYSPFWKLVIKNRLDAGWVFSNDSKKSVPFTELFLLGGAYNLRGFPINSQGPRKFSQSASNYAQNYNNEIQKTQQELSEKKVKLSALKAAQANKNKSEIDELSLIIAQDERTAFNQPFENIESFALRPYGGNQMFFYSLELEIPIIERAEIRGALFFDIGEVNNGLEFDLENQLRADIGVGIRWKSPFGPINLDWALPYRPRKEFEEQAWEFQFSVGNQF